MDIKNTSELLEIWTANDRVEWSDAAFDVVREILTSRIGELPPQVESIPEDERELTNEDLGLNEWEGRLIDRKSQPEFYDTWEVIRVRKNIDRAAIVVLVLNILTGVFTVPITKQIMTGYFFENPVIPAILSSLFLVSLGVALNILVTYFPLKALAYILRILMEMEFNSRIDK
jgi:hypothetical protein